MKNRTLSHALTTRRTVRKALPDAAMSRIENTVGMAERGTSGQVRLVIEATWPLLQVKQTSARARAVDWFSQLRVWDTEHNNGVLIYLLFAERRVEIVADRGINRCVAQATWDAICHSMEAQFAKHEFEQGLSYGVSAIGDLLREHFSAEMGHNEQSDRPVLA